MRLTFKMIGGPWEGEHAGGSDDRGKMASYFYRASKYGQVGQSFLVSSPWVYDAAIVVYVDGPPEVQKHCYKVTDRQPVEGGIYLTATHQGVVRRSS